MTEIPHDRDLKLAEQIASALKETTHYCIILVFLEMYRRDKRNEAALSTTLAFEIGQFSHGRIAGAAINKAVEEGFIAKKKCEGESSSLLYPTGKLLNFVQDMLNMGHTIIELETPGWNVEQSFLARSLTSEPELPLT